jgi:hypothetical protein
MVYGAAGSFVTVRTMGTVGCDLTTFGSDPIVGVVKACYLRTGAPTGFATRGATDGGTCAFTGFRTVAYGVSGAYIYRSFTTGVACDPAAFGRDPAYGVVKSCYLTP